MCFVPGGDNTRDLKEPLSSPGRVCRPLFSGDLSLGLTWARCLRLRAVVGLGIVLKSLARLWAKSSAKLEIYEGPGLLPAACIKLCEVHIRSCGCRIRVRGGNGLTWTPGREIGREMQC